MRATCCSTGRRCPTRTAFRDRPVVVVSKSFEYQQDLRRLKRFIREQKPLLVAVEAEPTHSSTSASGRR